MLGTLAAYGLARSPSRLRWPLALLFFLPITLPGLFLGISLLVFFARLEVDLSLQTVVDRPPRLRLPLLPAHSCRRTRPPRPGSRGNGCGSRRQPVQSLPASHAAADLAGPRWRNLPRVRAVVRRVHHHLLRHLARMRRCRCSSGRAFAARSTPPSTSISTCCCVIFARPLGGRLPAHPPRRAPARPRAGLGGGRDLT